MMGVGAALTLSAPLMQPPKHLLTVQDSLWCTAVVFGCYVD